MCSVMNSDIDKGYQYDAFYAFNRNADNVRFKQQFMFDITGNSSSHQQFDIDWIVMFSRKEIGRLCLSSMLVFSASFSLATGGRVNAAGCHNSQKIGYHCHPDRAASTSSAETKKQRSERLLRECKGRPNSGACLGYAS
jgi:hypothetical protein